MTTIPMKHTNQTQLEAVMDYLAEGKSLTALQALKYFGCFRLAAIIHVLRKEGVPIVTHMVKDGRSRNGYARYQLVA